MSKLSVTTDGDSPGSRQQYRYMLLDSPTGLSSRSTLPFLLLSFVVGIMLGGTLSTIGLPTSRTSSTFLSTSAGEISGSSVPSTSVDETAGSFLRKSAGSDSLSIAWLMSFPNSGTSYTSYLVRKVTGKNTASNYGTENLDQDGNSVGVFADSAGGPFWTDPLKYVRTDSGYLLTKTHCGGRCDQCGIDKYLENHQIFSRRCFEGHRISKSRKGELKEMVVSYSEDRVKRAVHLIRDPFDNIVSRFHLAYKHFAKRNQTHEMALYPKSKDGFLAFCQNQDRMFRREEMNSRFYADVLDVAKHVPCHADFFRYIQWHNLAFTTTWDLRIPTMVLHYENYTHDFNRTKEALLSFLGQEDAHAPPVFETGKTYREYFTDEEVQAVSSMFSKLAMAKTQDHTEHYFIE